MSNPFGTFTVKGSPEVEQLLTELVNEAAAAVEAALSPSDYRALILLGGYGRSEGGVEVVDGKERPHNNLDFMLIAKTSNSTELARLRQILLDAFEPTMRKYDIEFDISVISIWKLRLSPSLIIWYDMRFGHKIILGDETIMDAMTHFRLEKIPSRDAMRLLVNRASLLLINEHLMSLEDGENIHRRRIIRNNMKAIIGYGDALLYFRDAYHWSYVERKKRMQDRDDISIEFRSLYDEAAEFRLLPDYAKYESRDLTEWSVTLRSSLEPVHRACEEARLGLQNLDWAAYPEHALKHGLLDEPFSLRAWARKAIQLTKSCPTTSGLGMRARLGMRTLGPRGLYAIAYPAIAYSIKDEKLLRLTAELLGANTIDHDDLRDAYLSLWNSQGDINAGSTLRKWNAPSSATPPEIQK